MDQYNLFRYVRLLAASTGNVGADYVSDFYIELWRAAHKRKQLMGAYTAATKVYLTVHQNSS
jgi:hypothetical protein